MEDVMLKVLAALQNPAALAIGGFVVEAMLRLIKSDKPRSILYVIVGVLKVIAKVADGLVNFLDKILPQRLNEEKK